MRTVYLTHLVKMAAISLVKFFIYASQVHFSFVKAHKDRMRDVLMKMFLKAPLLYHDFQLNKFGSLARARQHF